MLLKGIYLGLNHVTGRSIPGMRGEFNGLALNGAVQCIKGAWVWGVEGHGHITQRSRGQGRGGRC